MGTCALDNKSQLRNNIGIFFISKVSRLVAEVQTDCYTKRCKEYGCWIAPAVVSSLFDSAHTPHIISNRGYLQATEALPLMAAT